MYVSINPLVRITFKEGYSVCISDKKETVCSDKTNKITDYELINDDAKEIYKDINLKGLSIVEALIKICDKAKDSLKNDMENGSKYTELLNVITGYFEKAR